MVANRSATTRRYWIRLSGWISPEIRMFRSANFQA